MQSDFVLYKNPVTPLTGSTSGATWAWIGAALSASTMVLRADQGLPRVKFARWVAVWNPRVSDPASPTSIRLISADFGPANIQQIGQVLSPAGAVSQAPRVDAVDVTSALNQIIDAGQVKTLGQQTFGNGANGCLIYASWIEVVWESAP